MKPAKMNEKQLLMAIRNCLKKINTSFYELGSMIDAIRGTGQWKEWQGYEYDHFETWCWDVLHFRERKAEELAKIYRVLSELSIPKDWHQKLLDLGWSKLRFVARVITNQNYRKWHAKASKLSYRELQAEVQIATGTRITDSTGSESKTGGKDAEGAADGPDGAGNGGDDGSLKMVLRFEHKEDLRHVQKALQVLENDTKVNNNGRLVGMLATSFLSFAARPHERGGLATSLKYMLKSIEGYFGVKLEVVKPPAKAKGKKKTLKKKKRGA